MSNMDFLSDSQKIDARYRASACRQSGTWPFQDLRTLHSAVSLSDVSLKNEHMTENDDSVYSKMSILQNFFEERYKKREI